MVQDVFVHPGAIVNDGDAVDVLLAPGVRGLLQPHVDRVRLGFEAVIDYLGERRRQPAIQEPSRRGVTRALERLAQVMVQAHYSVDRSRVPMTMDYLLAGGRKQYGIWSLEGNRLTTCFGAPGQERPTEFASLPGDGRTLTVWTPAGR